MNDGDFQWKSSDPQRSGKLIMKIHPSIGLPNLTCCDCGETKPYENGFVFVDFYNEHMCVQCWWGGIKEAAHRYLARKSLEQEYDRMVGQGQPEGKQ